MLDKAYIEGLLDDAEKKTAEKKLAELVKWEGILKQVTPGSDYYKELSAKIETRRKWQIGIKSERSTFTDKMRKIGLTNIGDSVSEYNYSFYGKTKEELLAIFENAGLIFLAGRDNFAPCNVPEGYTIIRKDNSVTLNRIG